MKSIRSYLLSRVLGGSAVVLAAAGLAVFIAVTRSLQEQFDANLADRVKGLASLLFQEEQHVEFEFSQELMPEYVREHEPAYFELWFEDGRLLERSDSLGENDLELLGTAASAPAFWTAALPDGRQGRFASQRVDVHHVFPELGPNRPAVATLVIVVALGREELVAAQTTLFVECAIAALVLLALIAIVTWLAVTRGLEPAVRLAVALDRIEIQHLPERLDVGAMPSELEPAARKADALIRRVDEALERERRTTADIAHELRTPISELLAVSEVALRDRGDADSATRALATVRRVAWRMGRSVSTILKLARLEMGAETCAADSVDLGGTVRELLRTLMPFKRERALEIDNQVDSGVLVECDRDVLRIIVSNLLGNALYYAPRGSSVTCRLERAPEAWCFTVENEAGDLRREDLPTLSEPFWRKDSARTDHERSGLGLALSRALAAKTGMELRFELEAGKFRASLVRASPASVDTRAGSRSA